MCTSRVYARILLIFLVAAGAVGGEAIGQTGLAPQTYTAPQVAAGRGLGFEFITTITLQNTLLVSCQVEVLLHRGAGQALDFNLEVDGQPFVNPNNVTLDPLGIRRLRIRAAQNQPGLFQGAARITDGCNGLLASAGFDVVPLAGAAAAPAAAADIPPEIFSYDPLHSIPLLPGQVGRTVVDIDPTGQDGLRNTPGIAVVGDPNNRNPSGTDFCGQIFNSNIQPVTGVNCLPFDGSHFTMNLDQIFPGVPPLNDAVWEFFVQSPGPANQVPADVLVIDVTEPNQFRQAPVDVFNPNCFQSSLCLNDDRFRVDVTATMGTTQVQGVPAPLDDDSGLFFFTGPDNFELLLKIIDGCSFNDHFWVFYGATTNVEFNVTVTDTATNQVKEYQNTLGNPAPAITDTQAFATCP